VLLLLVLVLLLLLLPGVGEQAQLAAQGRLHQRLSGALEKLGAACSSSSSTCRSDTAAAAAANKSALQQHRCVHQRLSDAVMMV
jgi:hypothetical protein